MRSEELDMVYVMSILIAIALAAIIVDLIDTRDRARKTEKGLRELRTRVNIIDEVQAQHSEELDELQRSFAKAQDALRGAQLTEGAQRVKELEEQSGKVCQIYTEERKDGIEQM